MARPKLETITFKVDSALARALDNVPNRSEFIRTAILAALDSTCPLCQGTGMLSPDQRNHWEAFAATHSLTKCDDCKSVYLTCDHGKRAVPHDGSKRRAKKT